MHNRILPLLIVIIVLIATSAVLAQKVEPGISQTKRIITNTEFSPGLPPNLVMSADDLKFIDDNLNGILEAEENALLVMTIHNTGAGPAQGVEIKLIDRKYDPALIIDSICRFPFIYEGTSVQASFKIYAGFDVKTMERKIDIIGTEIFNYNMNPGFLTFSTNEFVNPELTFSGMEIIDIGKNTFGNPIDGRLQKGEQVYLKIYIQNVAQNIAPNVKYLLRSEDPNIMLKDTNGQVCKVFSGELGDLDIGNVASFRVTISPNQLVKEEGVLPLYLTVTNDYNRGGLIDLALPLMLDQKPAEIVKLDVEANYEKLAKPFARFELPPENQAWKDFELIDISIAPISMTTRPDAIGIVIGVEKYDNFAPAPYAANDAAIMEKYFKDVLGLGYVKKYTDKDVTGNFFDNQFNPYYGKIKDFINKNKTDVFVYYSGHGLPSKDGKRSYLIPADCNKLAFEKQGYELSKLYDNLDSLGARSVTIFLDACFSGDSKITESLQPVNLASTKGVYVKLPESQPWLTNPNFAVFSSSTFDQTSIAFDKVKYGLFTYYLCAGIQGNADTNADEKIYLDELTQYVINNVSERSRRTLGLQTPVFHGTNNIVLVEFDK